MFPYIEVSGTHRAIGEAIGESLRKPIQKSLALHLARYRQQAQKAPPKAFVKLMATATRYFPQYVEEIAGIARGSGVALANLLVFAFEEELSPGEKCTTLAVKTSETIFFAHNEDWDIKLPLYVVKGKPKGEPAFVSVANVGQFPGTVSGFNEHGVAYAGNSVDTATNFSGLAKIFFLRAFLACKSIAQAERIVARHPRAIGNNSIIVSGKERTVAMLEWSPKAYRLVAAPRSLTHTNHFVVPALCRAQSHPTTYSSAKRLAFVNEALQKITAPKLNDIKKIMSAHINTRTAICRHSGYETLTSVIVDTAARTMHVAAGTPCNHPYKSFSL